MKLTEAEKRRNLLQYFADENAKQVFPPRPRRERSRTAQLVDDGFLVVCGFSVTWGDLYAITPAGRAALNGGRSDG